MLCREVTGRRYFFCILHFVVVGEIPTLSNLLESLYSHFFSNLYCSCFHFTFTFCFVSKKWKLGKTNGNILSNGWIDQSRRNCLVLQSMWREIHPSYEDKSFSYRKYCRTIYILRYIIYTSIILQFTLI